MRKRTYDDGRSKDDGNVELIEALGICPGVGGDVRGGYAPRDETVLHDVDKGGGLDDCVVRGFWLWVALDAWLEDEVVVVRSGPVDTDGRMLGTDGDPVVGVAC